MGVWVLASELIRQEKISEFNLASAVMEKEITAYDLNSSKPIEWEKFKDEYSILQKIAEKQQAEEKEIVRLREEEYIKYVKKHGESDEIFFRIFNVFENSFKSIFNRKIITFDSHDIFKYEFVKWEDILKYATGGKRVEVSFLQYMQLREEWGMDMISYYLKRAKFKKEDVKNLICSLSSEVASTDSPELNPKHPWYSEQLANAIQAWRELYLNRAGNKDDNTFKPKGGNVVMIHKWLINHIDHTMPDATKQHYSFIVNPSKKGGSAKIPE